MLLIWLLPGSKMVHVLLVFSSLVENLYIKDNGLWDSLANKRRINFKAEVIHGPGMVTV